MEDYDDLLRFNRTGERREKDRDLFKVVEEVFDRQTLLTLVDLMRRKVVKSISGVVSTGKEARVYYGQGFDGTPLAIKIYYVSTADFKRGRLKYIAGDPRFKGLKPSSTRKLVYLWAAKEYGNLKRMYESGVKVPRPIAYMNNVLVMEFVGEDGLRYPLLRECYKELTEAEIASIYELVLEEVDKIVCKARLVHGDLSEYNVIVKPTIDIAIIDVGQAVSVTHPQAPQMLMRDLENLTRFFREEAGLRDLQDPLKIYEGLSPCLSREGAA
ncbi:MAG: serine protein kinase RIO [Desulfurococcaceae archaeon]